MIENFNNLSPKEKLKYLKENNIPVYSISKLSTLEECYYEYFLTYIKKLKGAENIYTYMGSAIHSCLESLQNGEHIDFDKKIKQELENARVLGLDFPSVDIGEKWKTDILTFAQNYTPLNLSKFETEKLFIYELNGIYLQGIIDLLIYNEDGTVSIIDYKTSGKFTKSNLESKGRQLILYGLGMEQLGYKVKDLEWYMLKYVSIDYKLKNGNIKNTIAERGYIVDKLQKDIEKELLKEGYDPLEVNTMLNTSILTNDLSILPKKIQNKYNIKDYFMPYDFSEEHKLETRSFIEAKVQEIENCKDKEYYWEPKEITPYTEFYCKQLCSKKEYCEYYKEYEENKKEIEQEKLDQKSQEDFDNMVKLFQ